MAPFIIQNDSSKNPKRFFYDTFHVSEGFFKEPQKGSLVYTGKNP